MDKLKRLELLKDFIQEAVDRGASSVEEIHQYIADLPFEALEKAGLLKADTRGLRSLSQRTIGLVYGAVRRINHGIGQLISDQIENIEETRDVATLLRENAVPVKTAAVPTEPVIAVLPVAKKRAPTTKTAAKKSAAAKKPAKKTANSKKPAAKKPAARKR